MILLHAPDLISAENKGFMFPESKDLFEGRLAANVDDLCPSSSSYSDLRRFKLFAVRGDLSSSCLLSSLLR